MQSRNANRRANFRAGLIRRLNVQQQGHDEESERGASFSSADSSSVTRRLSSSGRRASTLGADIGDAAIAAAAIAIVRDADNSRHHASGRSASFSSASMLTALEAISLAAGSEDSGSPGRGGSGAASPGALSPTLQRVPRSASSDVPSFGSPFQLLQQRVSLSPRPPAPLSAPASSGKASSAAYALVPAGADGGGKAGGGGGGSGGRALSSDVPSFALVATLLQPEGGAGLLQPEGGAGGAPAAAATAASPGGSSETHAGGGGRQHRQSGVCLSASAEQGSGRGGGDSTAAAAAPHPSQPTPSRSSGGGSCPPAPRSLGAVPGGTRARTASEGGAAAGLAPPALLLSPPALPSPPHQQAQAQQTPLSPVAAGGSSEAAAAAHLAALALRQLSLRAQRHAAWAAALAAPEADGGVPGAGNAAARPLLRELAPRRPVVKRHPAWVVSAGAPGCQHCATRFTLTQRRHHCRGCGALTCAACTPFRTPRFERLCWFCSALGRGAVLRETRHDSAAFCAAVGALEAEEVQRRLDWGQPVAVWVGVEGVTPLHVAVSVCSNAMLRQQQADAAAAAAAAAGGSDSARHASPMLIAWSGIGDDGGALAAAAAEAAATAAAAAAAAVSARREAGVPATGPASSRLQQPQNPSGATRPLQSPPGSGTSSGAGSSGPSPLAAAAAAAVVSPLLLPRAEIGAHQAASRGAVAVAVTAAAAGGRQSPSLGPQAAAAPPLPSPLSPLLRSAPSASQLLFRSSGGGGPPIPLLHPPLPPLPPPSLLLPPPPLDPSLERQARAVIALLLDHDADVTAATYAGRTPLHAAALWGTAAVVRLLLDRGALQARRDASGLTAYDCAMLRAAGGDPEGAAIQRLLDRRYATGTLRLHAALLRRLREWKPRPRPAAAADGGGAPDLDAAASLAAAVAVAHRRLQARAAAAAGRPPATAPADDSCVGEDATGAAGYSEALGSCCPLCGGGYGDGGSGSGGDGGGVGTGLLCDCGEEAAGGGGGEAGGDAATAAASAALDDEALEEGTAEALPMPSRMQLMDLGIAVLEPPAQALQANLMALRNDYERRANAGLWARHFPGARVLRARLVELELLPPASAHELGWRREVVLVAQAWRAGHTLPAAAAAAAAAAAGASPEGPETDVSDAVEAAYRAANPRSPFNDVLEIRADRELRLAR